MGNCSSWVLITNVGFVKFGNYRDLTIYPQAIVIDLEPSDKTSGVGQERKITGLTWGCILVFELSIFPDTSLKIENIRKSEMVQLNQNEPVYVYTPGLTLHSSGKSLDILNFYLGKPMRIEKIYHFPERNELDNHLLEYQRGGYYPQVTWKSTSFF